MMKAFALLLSLPLVACTVGSGAMNPGGGGGTMGDDDGSGSGNPMPTSGISGHITANATWMGAEAITDAVTIDPGVTVTVMPGTSISVDTSATITISGTLDIEGTTGTGNGVTIAATGAAFFGGISIPAGGMLTMKYTTLTGAEVTTSGTGITTISDSHLSNSPGDLLIMNGGNVTVMYSQLGVEAPAIDSTHCNMHFAGAGNVIKVSHTSVTNTPATNPSAPTYGIMFYSGQGADFTYDNWVSNSNNIEPDPGVNGDFSFGYFTGTVASVTGLTMNSLAVARLAVCDGNNDAMCAGPHP